VASNGIYTNGQLIPNCTETWASLSGGWSTYTSWEFTPLLPLTYTTPVIDFGRIDTVNPLTSFSASHPMNTTINYGNTVDSSGGSIDSPSTVNVTPSSAVTSITGRYFQFTFSVDYDDSAGDSVTPFIQEIKTNISKDTKQIFKDSIDSSTLSGSTGQRELSVPGDLGSVISAVITPHTATSTTTYVADTYVASGYVETIVGDITLPHIVLDKSTDPITLNIRDLNTYGKTNIDCTFDAVLVGLPGMTADVDGQIVEA